MIQQMHYINRLMILKNIMILIIFFNISLFSEENKLTKNIILKSNPIGAIVKVYLHSSEIYKSITPAEFYLEGGIYSIIISKKGYLDKKINIYIVNNQIFSEEILLEFDEKALSKLDMESIKREENKKKVISPKEDIVSESVDQKIEKLFKENPSKTTEKSEETKQIIKKEPIENSTIPIEIQNKEETPIKKDNKYILIPDKKLGDVMIAGLSWDGNSNKLSLSRDEAGLYCKGLNKRLPTSKELTTSWKELKDFGWFWTSSVSTDPPGKIMIVSLYTGEILNFENTDIKAYVRCVK